MYHHLSLPSYVHGREEWETMLAVVAKKILGCLSPHVKECLVAREGVRLVGLCGFLKLMPSMLFGLTKALQVVFSKGLLSKRLRKKCLKLKMAMFVVTLPVTKIM